jgi:hypothetical protein
VESAIRTRDNRGETVQGARDPIPSWLVMPVALAARKIADAVAARRREQVLTAHSWAGMLLARHAPWLVRAVTRRSVKYAEAIERSVGRPH